MSNIIIKDVICNLCENVIQPNEEVVMEQHGVIVDGEFAGSEPPTIRHEECEEF